MASGRTPVSPRGLILLAATAVVGLVLAIHGWSAHNRSRLPGPLAGSGPASTTPAAGPDAATPHPRRASASPSAGPLLRSQPFAPYAFRVWPGPPSSAAKSAMTGLSISVRKRGNGLLVTAALVGQAARQPKFYLGGTDVYVVEATMGDDSGNTDYNLGDDGLVVTSAAGRILR
ncbi:MAG TPA: hypothetical protein VHU92_13535 [Streptosporangiaceae bacterium]|jgi:hypothetical protein|nr:hypothetical protein [Streptosporangiaceae bacterium]